MAVTKNTRVLGSTLGLDINEKDYWCDIGKFELAPADGDKDVLTFADAHGGAASTWSLKGTAIISFDTGSFWEMAWANAGKTVTFVLAPLGNKTASQSKPHFKGRVKIGSKPPISSEAGDTKGSTFEFEWTLEGEPEKVTTESTLGTGAAEDEE